MHSRNRVKSGPLLWPITVIKSLSKVNNHPMGESSPNLVTLAEAENLLVVKPKEVHKDNFHKLLHYFEDN
jgi:hypothetical protein